MPNQRTAWGRYLALLALLASCSLDFSAGGGTDTKDAPKPLEPEVILSWKDDWKDAGADIGWMKDLPPRGTGGHQFWDPWRTKGEAGAIPAFRFPKRDVDGVLVKLPDPGTAFGLDFHCGFNAGV